MRLIGASIHNEHHLYRLAWRWLCTLAVFLFALGIFASFISGRHNLPSQLFDFGERPFGSVVEHTFFLENVGFRRLEVDRVLTSCGCTTAGELPRIIPARGRVELKVAATLEKDGDQFAQEAVVYVRGQRPVHLVMKGIVIRELPAVVEFGELKRGNKVSRTFLYRAIGPGDVDVSNVQYAKALFEIGYKRAGLKMRDMEFTVDIREDVPFGRFSEDLVIFSKDDSAARTVRLDGTVVSPVRIEPEFMTFPAIQAGESQTRQVRLYSPYGLQFTVERVTPSDAELICVDPQSPKQNADGHIYVVQVRGQKDRRILSGKITFHVVTEGKTYNIVQSIYAMSAP